MSGSATAGRALLLRLPPQTGFVLRTLLAYALACYVAYQLELESPYSAGTTVLIVAASSRGAVLSKSFWRVLGSAIGILASVVLLAAFSQSPVVFVFGLALWLGMCTFISSLLRYFRSYGAVLAGYTVTLVAIPAVSDPDRIFELATARLAVVVIGVLTTALVFLVTDRGPPPTALERQASSLFADAARMIHEAIEDASIAHLAETRSRIATALLGLDQTVEYTAAEDAVFARYATNLRISAASLYAAVVGAERVARLLSAPALAADARIAAAREAMLELTAALMHPVAGAEAFRLRRTAIATTRHGIATSADSCHDMAVLAALDQTVALLDQLLITTVHVSVLFGRSVRPVTRLRVYTNPVTAWRNGARAAIACSIAGIFWIVSQWPAGGLMLLLLGPISALLALTESAAAASLAFMKGTLISSIAAFFVTFGILPQMTGFPLLMATMLPFITAGLIYATRPATAGMATAFLIFFNTQVSADNPMRFDLAGNLNTYLAFNAAAFCAVLAFRVLLPPDPVAEGMVLMRSIRNSLARVARGRRQVWLAWEHLQHQKLTRLSRRLAGRPIVRASAVEGALTAVLIGRGLIRLYTALDDPRLPRDTHATLMRALPALRHLHAMPVAAADAAQEAATALAEPDALPATLHAAATLHELAALIRADVGFFESCGGVQREA